MSNSDAILLEDINHKFDTLLEYVKPLKTMQIDIAQLKEYVAELKSDSQMFRTLWRDHENRLTKLEPR